MSRYTVDHCCKLHSEKEQKTINKQRLDREKARKKKGKKESKSETLLATTNIYSEHLRTWFIDPSATNHMCSGGEVFSIDLLEASKVFLGNDSAMKVERQGTCAVGSALGQWSYQLSQAS